MPGDASWRPGKSLYPPNRRLHRVDRYLSSSWTSKKDSTWRPNSYY